MRKGRLPFAMTLFFLEFFQTALDLPTSFLKNYTEILKAFRKYIMYKVVYRRTDQLRYRGRFILKVKVKEHQVKNVVAFGSLNRSLNCLNSLN